MNIRLLLLVVLLIAALTLLAGCAASDEGEKDQATNTPPVVEKRADPAPVEKAPVKEQAPPPQETPKETPNETVRETPPPPAAETTPVKPDGKFSVQVGAYSMPEKASQIAATAKTRFSKRVYTLRDEKTNNIKVLVGDFGSKDEARSFRDQIIQQFPEDYKGAWVYDVSKH